MDELDGLTVTGEGWWFNVRPSNTEPLLRLNIEAADADAVAALRDEVLGRHPRLRRRTDHPTTDPIGALP